MDRIDKPRLFSGMQPSGELHIGNYLGALKQWAALVESRAFDAIFCIVDAHAVTVEYDTREMRRRIIDAAASYIAGGIDPEKATVFVQSDVPHHMELAWYLACVTPMGDLGRMTQFKEKSDQHKQNINAGLFFYPVLMAADILLYKASVVPVGDDQVQHLELSREICRKFNARFGDIFPEPKPRLSVTPRIMGLDGQGKMSKSKNNALGLLDPPDLIWDKLRPAFTDPQRLRKSDPGRPEVCNIFTMHKAVSPPETVAEVDTNCRTAGWGCADCKRALHVNLVRELSPIREKAEALRARPDFVEDILRTGARRCGAIAEGTMREVKDAMGLGTAPVATH
jgi:tryptophanyl-tRNA synthetase